MFKPSLYLRLSIFISILILNIGFGYAQSEKDSFEDIRDHFTWINQQTDYKVVELNNEDFEDEMPDNGAQVKGYFRNDTLYKIVRWQGLSYAIMITEYYLWENELVFVYDMEKNYKQVLDSVNGFMGFDYSIADVKYESRYYFVNGKKVKEINNGQRLISHYQNGPFIDDIELFRPLLINRLQNDSAYNLIQGRWISTKDSMNSIVFEGLIKSDFQNGKYDRASRMKIEEKLLICSTLKKHDSTMYEIKTLTNEQLTLMNLLSKQLLTYKKVVK